MFVDMMHLKKFSISYRLKVVSDSLFGGIQKLRGQDEGGGGGQKMSVFVHAQGIKTVHPRGGSKNGKILST